jgi:spore maturation protein CgeB
MNARPLDIVFIGLSLSSSWGNGHATTYRSLLKGLHSRGHRVTFFERDVPWYAGHRDLEAPDYCELRYYDAVADLRTKHGGALRRADAIIVGSYVPDGVTAIDAAVALSTGKFCFYDIDTPVTLAKLANSEEEYIAPRQVHLFDIYFSFTGGPTLTRLEKQHGARRAEPLYCSADVEAHRSTGEPKCWDLGYIGTYSADRQPALERLLLDTAREMPERRFVVAGSLYPARIDWPSNVERIEHLSPADHPSFYTRQRYTLNLTRADMIAAGWSPSVRLFEAAACGTPVISDDWPGLDEFFPRGKAICTASSTSDVIEVLNQDERSRSAIAAAANASAIGLHSGAARAAELEQWLRRGTPAARKQRAGLVDETL